MNRQPHNSETVPDSPQVAVPLEEQVTIVPRSDDTPALPDPCLGHARPSPCPMPKVPGYCLENELGRGGMGVVYLARQVRLNRLVALKMILSASHACEKTRYRFLVEAEAIARLQHPGIVQVHEFGTHDNNPYFAMEYVRGGSLEKKLAGTPLHPNEAADLVHKLALAVQAAHDLGMIHRDLKPANILLAEDSATTSASHPRLNALQPGLRTFFPKISDFGLVKQAGQDMTITGHIIGTPSYMAPEQADCKKEVGPAVDIYALGAILYECLTGRPPFKAATPIDTLLQVVNNDAVCVRQLQPRVPRGLELICMKCLQKQPIKRYATARALAEDLGRYLAGEPVLAQPPHWLPRASEWFRKHPWALVNLSVILCALLLSATYGFWTRSIEAQWHQLRAEARVDRLENRPEAAMARLKAAARWYVDPRLYDEAVEIYKPHVSTRIFGQAYWMLVTSLQQAAAAPVQQNQQAIVPDETWQGVMEKPATATLSPDKQWIVLSQEKGNALALVNAQTKQLLHWLTPLPGRPQNWYQQVHLDEMAELSSRVVFSKDSRLVACPLTVHLGQTTRHAIVIFDLASGTEFLRLPAESTGQLALHQDGFMIVDKSRALATVWNSVMLHDILADQQALSWKHAMIDDPTTNDTPVYLDHAVRWLQQKTGLPPLLLSFAIIFSPWVVVHVLARHLAACRVSSRLPQPAYLLLGAVVGVLAVTFGLLYLFTYFNTLGWSWEELFTGSDLYVWFLGSILSGTQLLVMTANAYRVAEFGDAWQEHALLGLSSGKLSP